MIIKLFAVYVLSGLCLASIASGYVATNGSHICCNGVLGNASVMDCCEPGQIFDTTKDLCCDGQLTKGVSTMTNYSCCYNEATKTQKPFNLITQICCPEAIVNKTNPDKKYGCCGPDKIYDYEQFFCCNDKIIPGGPKKACCGDNKTYDIDRMFCKASYDDGSLTYKLVEIENNKTAHCDKEMYDPLKSACCFDNNKGVIVPNDKGVKNPACCVLPKRPGGIDAKIFTPILYNFKSQSCCDGLVLDIPNDLAEFGARCCAGKVISQKQICCANQIYEGPGVCCNNVFFSGENKLCCKVKEGSQQVFNEKEKLCCGSQLINKSSNSLECCFSAGMTFDNTKENCGYSSITPKSQTELNVQTDMFNTCGSNFRQRLEPIIVY